MRHIADQAIPRTVVTIAEERDGPENVYVVLELVQGMTLAEYCYEFVKQGQLAAAEDRMIPVAAQLLDTLQALHGRAHVAHLDLTSNNVMIRHDAVRPFDNVRMVDWGFSGRCKAGIRDVVPPGLTPDFAAPEVLRSFFKSFGNARCPNRKVDGPAADMYSVGTAMFEMLTGSTPFPCRKTNYPQIKVPKEIPQRSEELWQMAAAVQKLQTSWVKAFHMHNGGCVQHPILDKVRRCSSTPEEAVHFFTRILHPNALMRATATQALEHPYIRRCAAEMHAYLAAQTPVAKEQDQDSPDEKLSAKPGKHKLLVRVRGAARKQGGRLARTAGHVLKCLPLFKGRHQSACKNTAGSGNMSNTDSASSSSMSTSSSSSSSKPPLSAYFIPYKHEPEQHISKQDHKEASAGGAEHCSEHETQSAREQQPENSLHVHGKEGSEAISMQACTSKQPPGTDQQTTGVPNVCARQAVMPVGQVIHTEHPKQSVPVHACSALSAVPAASKPCQPSLSQVPARCGTDEEQAPPVLSPSRYCLCSAYCRAPVRNTNGHSAASAYMDAVP
ncbi:hypothetical protein ABBQ38_013267 [Trebouxia sp. C0009 RCD-2024]